MSRLIPIAQSAAPKETLLTLRPYRDVCQVGWTAPRTGNGPPLVRRLNPLHPASSIVGDEGRSPRERRSFVLHQYDPRGGRGRRTRPIVRACRIRTPDAHARCRHRRCRRDARDEAVPARGHARTVEREAPNPARPLVCGDPKPEGHGPRRPGRPDEPGRVGQRSQVAARRRRGRRDGRGAYLCGPAFVLDHRERRPHRGRSHDQDRGSLVLRRHRSQASGPGAARVARRRCGRVLDVPGPARRHAEGGRLVHGCPGGRRRRRLAPPAAVGRHPVHPGPHRRRARVRTGRYRRMAPAERPHRQSRRGRLPRHRPLERRPTVRRASRPGLAFQAAGASGGWRRSALRRSAADRRGLDGVLRRFARCRRAAARHHTRRRYRSRGGRPSERCRGATANFGRCSGRGRRRCMATAGHCRSHRRTMAWFVGFRRDCRPDGPRANSLTRRLAVRPSGRSRRRVRRGARPRVRGATQRQTGRTGCTCDRRSPHLR